MSSASRYTPVPAAEGGFVSLTLPSNAPVGLADFAPIPMGANALWLQPQGGDVYYRMDGQRASGGMLLSGGTYLCPTDRTALDQLVLTDGAGTTIAVQYFRGAVGYPPPVPA
jgi:hypothetical protein